MFEAPGVTTDFGHLDDQLGVTTDFGHVPFYVLMFEAETECRRRHSVLWQWWGLALSRNHGRQLEACLVGLAFEVVADAAPLTHRKGWSERKKNVRGAWRYD